VSALLKFAHHGLLLFLGRFRFHYIQKAANRVVGEEIRSDQGIRGIGRLNFKAASFLGATAILAVFVDFFAHHSVDFLFSNTLQLC